MITYNSLLLASIASLGLATAALAEGSQMQSAGALAFDNGNVLFVGDGKDGVVHAFDFGKSGFEDQTGYDLGRAQTFEGRTIFNGLDKEIAALLGVAAEDIIINDMVVHKPSKQIILSVHRGLGPDAEPVLIKINNGAVELLNFDKAAHTSMSVGPVLAEATLEFGQPLNSLAITDIDYYNGEIFVAGISNEEFSSKLRRMAYPIDDTIST